ncbi:MAG: Gfo/Idh/MocA family oxidoreductase [Clostridia bacterium]
MSKIRLGLIGGGKRSEYFMRAVKYLPEVFEVSSAYMRNPEKAAIYGEKFGIKTTTSFEEMLADKPEFVILCLPRSVTLGYIEKLFQAKMPILCETPPASSVEELNELWSLIKKYDGKMQVSEQYFAWPLYSAWLNAIDQGLIGEPNLVNMGAIHGYHGVNMINRFLKITNENCVIRGKQYKTAVTLCEDRTGKVYTDEITEQVQDMVSFEFENGKFAFYNWSNMQYHSDIRTRHITVQGTKGEIDDLTIRYINSENHVVAQTLNRVDLGVYNITEWSNKGIMLGDKFIYESPFPQARVNDDELAVATCMYKMRAFVEKGEEFYPMKEALQDSYLSLLLYQSVKTPLEPIQSETQSWYK